MIDQLESLPDLQAVPDLPDGPFPGADTAVAAALSVPLVRVTHADGRVLQVQATNPDLIRYEDTAAKHRWPGMDKAPMRWLSFVAFAALQRTGQLEPGTGFDAWLATTVEVAGIAQPVPPTRPGPAPG